jgi:hypothetical protein
LGIEVRDAVTKRSDVLLALRRIFSGFPQLADLRGFLIALCLDLLGFGDTSAALAVEFLEGGHVKCETARRQTSPNLG